MTTWFVDPEAGADANAGTSFALRKRTLGAITLAAGDAVRVIASPSPISLGSATWTDNSSTVTLGTAQTLTVDDCETAWTAATNVTANTSTTRKQGTLAATFLIASGFTTGLIGFKAVSALDLSAYSCISLWLYTAGTALAQGVSVALCSDSAGATPIVTLPMPTWLVGAALGAAPFPVLFENGGSALPSGINSIALYASSGKPFSSTGTLTIDNVIATKAWGAAGHLSHGCALGKNTTGEPEWYPIMSIDGATVVLGNRTDFGVTAPVTKYRGVTESVTTFTPVPLRTRSTTALAGAAGTITAQTTITGGWDRTTMSSQTGVTWLSGEFIQPYSINNSAGFAYITQPDATIGTMHNRTGAVNFGSQQGRICHLMGVVNCSTPLVFSGGTNPQVGDYDLGTVVYNDSAIQPDFNVTSPLKLRARRVTGTHGIGFTCNAIYEDSMHDVMISSIDNCTFAILNTNGRIRIRGMTAKNNSNATLQDNAASGQTLLDRPVLSDATLINFINNSQQSVRATAVGGARWDNRVYTYAVTQLVVQTPVHGTSAQSVSMLVNDFTRCSGGVFASRLARVACLSGKTVTFSAWMQRTTQFANAGLLVRAGSVAGVIDTSAQGVAANNTWEQVTVSFTPTEDGVVDIDAFVQAQATVSANGTLVYFGDTAVSST